MSQRALRFVFAVGWSVVAPAGLVAGGSERAPLATSAYFSFHSDFDTNLNDALIVAGKARSRDQSELFHSGEEETCFAGLAPSVRAGWDRAVDYYAEIISPAGWDDRQQILLRFELAGIAEPEDDRARRFVAIARGFLMAAAPAYEACRWGAQDAENRAWLADLTPHLEAHAAAIGPRLEKAYGRAWHGLPIAVDLVASAPPLGASTWILTPGGHVLLSTATERSDALEIVFHEASHTLVAPWRPDPLPRALQEAAEELGVELPRDLWHVVLFYTTGSVVRDALEAAGEPGYTPYVYAHDLWSGPWGRFREGVEATWPAFLKGESTLAEAARELLGFGILPAQ